MKTLRHAQDVKQLELSLLPNSIPFGFLETSLPFNLFCFTGKLKSNHLTLKHNYEVTTIYYLQFNI